MKLEIELEKDMLITISYEQKAIDKYNEEEKKKEEYLASLCEEPLN